MKYIGLVLLLLCCKQKTQESMPKDADTASFLILDKSQKFKIKEVGIIKDEKLGLASLAVVYSPNLRGIVSVAKLCYKGLSKENCITTTPFVNDHIVEHYPEGSYDITVHSCFDSAKEITFENCKRVQFESAENTINHSQDPVHLQLTREYYQTRRKHDVYARVFFKGLDSKNEIDQSIISFGSNALVNDLRTIDSETLNILYPSNEKENGLNLSDESGPSFLASEPSEKFFHT